jgi:cell division protease FtsH
MQLPVDDRHGYSKAYLINQLAILMGGRVAEELVLKEMTTGAGNDLERATDLARKMVCEWGMSEKMGPLTFGKQNEQVFLGREMGSQRDFSDQIAMEIDQEVRRLVTENYERAKRLLTENMASLKRLAEALLEKEVLDGSDIDQILMQSTSQAVPA